LISLSKGGLELENILTDSLKSVYGLNKAGVERRRRKLHGELFTWLDEAFKQGYQNARFQFLRAENMKTAVF
jgi:hypothetical protein